MEIHNGILVVRITVGNYSSDGCLRTGPRRCGYCDKGRYLLHDLQETSQLSDFRIRADDACGSSLCRIHRRSSADRDKAVTGVFQIELLDFIHDVDGGVGFHLRKQDVPDAGTVELLQNYRSELFSD